MYTGKVCESLIDLRIPGFVCFNEALSLPSLSMAKARREWRSIFRDTCGSEKCSGEYVNTAKVFMHEQSSRKDKTRTGRSNVRDTFGPVKCSGLKQKLGKRKMRIEPHIPGSV